MFNVNLITDKAKAIQIKGNAQYEVFRMGKRKDFIINSSANSTQMLNERQSDKVRYQADFDEASARFASLSEGKEKERLSVDIKELEWKLAKLTLYTNREVSVDELVQDALEIEKINVVITLYNTFIAALDARIAEL